MNRNTKLVLIVIAALTLIGVGTYFYQKTLSKPQNQNQGQYQNQQQTTKEPKLDANTESLKDNDEAFKNALNLFADKKEAGVDFSNGPCLGEIAPGWVLDIAHNPRQPVDDKAENQCEDYRKGKVTHFIELDPDGKLIKVVN